ncbi:MAG: CBS domain-containing protein [Planctomycetes bacterium]|nr:CBS domain-containing protein [Planctomycetota bacterium]
MQVDELMTRDVWTCAPQDDLAAAAGAMWERDCGCVPVVDGQRKVVGMVTDRDICMAAWIKGRKLHEIGVSEVMSERVIACRVDEVAECAEALMREHGVRRLPVLDLDGKLAGLLSLADLACEARRENGRLWRDVDSLEVALTLAGICQPRRGARSDGEPLLIAEESEFALDPVRRTESVQVVRETTRVAAAVS